MGQIRRDSIINTVITYVGIGLGYLNVGLLLPILLESEHVGLLSVCLTLAKFYAQLSDFGNGLVLLRFIPFMGGSKDGYSGILRHAFAMLLIGMIAVTTIFVFTKSTISGVYDDNAPELIKYIWVIVPIGASLAFFNLMEAYLRSLSDNVVTIILQDFVLRICIFILLISKYFDLIGLNAFILLYFALHFVPSIGVLIYVIRKKNFFIHKKYSSLRSRLKKMMTSYGIYVYFNSLGRNIILIADVSMLTAMKGLEAVGVFAIMVAMSNALFVPYVALVRIASPHIPRFWKKRQMTELNDMYINVSSVGYFITMALFIPIWYNIDLVLAVFPPEYAAGKYVFFFLTVGKLFDAIGGINGFILMTSKKFKLEIILTIPLIFITFLLNYLMIPRFGGVGAAIATSFVFLAYNFLRLVIIYRYFKLNAIKPALVIMIVYGAGIIWASEFIPHIDNRILDLILRGSTSFAAFVVPILMLKLSPDVNRFLYQSVRFLKKAK